VRDIFLKGGKRGALWGEIMKHIIILPNMQKKEKQCEVNHQLFKKAFFTR